MSTSFFPPTMTMLQTLLDHPDNFVSEPSADAATARQTEYAHRAGYRVGANGEWVFELATR
jgi:hypothetical protein